MLIFFEDDDAGALAHDEALAVPVIGPARLLRPVVVARVERAGLSEAGDPDRADRRFRAARQHDVGIVAASSSRIILAASPIEGAPVDKAVTTAWFGPIRPYFMLT